MLMTLTRARRAHGVLAPGESRRLSRQRWPGPRPALLCQPWSGGAGLYRRLATLIHYLSTRRHAFRICVGGTRTGSARSDRPSCHQREIRRIDVLRRRSLDGCLNRCGTIGRRALRCVDARSGRPPARQHEQSARRRTAPQRSSCCIEPATKAGRCRSSPCAARCSRAAMPVNGQRPRFAARTPHSTRTNPIRTAAHR